VKRNVSDAPKAKKKSQTTYPSQIMSPALREKKEKRSDFSSKKRLLTDQ